MDKNMDQRIATLNEITDYIVNIQHRIHCEYHGWNGKDVFTILWDANNTYPVLYFNEKYYEIDAPQGDDPLTFRQVLTYLGMPNIYVTIEQVVYEYVNNILLDKGVIRTWNEDILVNEIMDSSVELGHYFINRVPNNGRYLFVLEML